MRTRLPLMTFDRECAFCRRWIERWRAKTKGLIAFVPYQKINAYFPEIPTRAFASSVHLIEPNGDVRTGAAAVFRAFELSGKKWLARLYRSVPGFAAVSELIYRLVAGHRTLFSKLERALTTDGGTH